MGAYHLHITCDVCLAPLHGMRERGIAIVVFVALYVGLILEIDAVFIAEIIPVGIVGVV